MKIRLQTQDPKRPIYSGAIDCFKQIVAKESPAGLFKGWRSPVYGQFIFNAIVFSIEGQVVLVVLTLHDFKLRRTVSWREYHRIYEMQN